MLKAITVLLLLASAWHGVADAMTFRVAEEGTGKVILAAGEILPGDDQKLHRLVGQLPPTTRLVGVALDSDGGNLLEGVRLAHTIRSSNLRTTVSANNVCASACFLMFAAGSTKSVYEHARVGVHSASVSGEDNFGAQALTTLMARKAADFGVPASIIGKMVTTTPNDIWWLTSNDLADMGVDIKVTAAETYRPGSALVPGQDLRPGPAPEMTENQGSSAPVATAYDQGRSDRMAIELWLKSQAGEARAGADWWAANRSKAAHNHLSCQMPGFQAAFANGCIDAKALFDPTDRRRLAEPEYRAGWNSL